MAFIDKKNDGLENDSELDPIDEILKRINESRIDLPEQKAKEPTPEETDLEDTASEDTASEETAAEEPVQEKPVKGEPVLDKKEEILALIAEPEEEEDGDEPEEETNEEESLEEEIDESSRCIRCGKRRRDLSVSEDYEYCSKCREAMRNAPMSWKGVVCALSLLIIAGVALLLAANTAVIALSVTEAKDYEAENRLNDALTSYTAAQKAADDLNTSYKSAFYFCGTKTFVDKMLVTAKTSGALSVGDTLSKAPVKNAVNFKSPWQKPLKQYNDSYAVFKVTNTAVEPIVSKYQDAEAADIPYDEVISKLDALKTGKDAKKYAFYIIEYYKATIAGLADKGAETELKFILEVKTLAPKESWLYNPYLANCYQRLNKYDELIKICNTMTAENANDISAYSMKARALCSQKDFKGALAVCGDIEKNNSASAAAYALKAEVYRRSDNLTAAAAACADGIKKSEGSTELYRQQAIVYLLQGNKKSAYDSAYNAYNSGYYNQDTTLELMNTVALCASLAGEKDMYSETVSSLKQYGYELSDSVTKCIKGTMTLKEIFVSGKGDVL